MIRFALTCSNRHGFEGWFASSEGYETQRSTGAISCPVCGDIDVRKALMTPALKGGHKREKAEVPVTAKPDPELLQMLRKVREHLTSNADYVGDRFAEEARRIHFDEVEKRGIFGEATVDEVRALAEDGVEFHPLPVLPEDHN